MGGHPEDVSDFVGREISQLRVELGRLRRHVDQRMDRLEEASERTRTAVQGCQRERSGLTGCAVGRALSNHTRGARQAVQNRMQRTSLALNAVSVVAVVLIALLK
jgi:hypothetical protein